MRGNNHRDTARAFQTDDTAHQALNYVNNSNPSQDAVKSTRQSRVREAEPVTSGIKRPEGSGMTRTTVASDSKGRNV